MSDLLEQGLWISVIGLSILFIAMGLLFVVMMLLERLSRGLTRLVKQEEAGLTRDPTALEQAKNDEITAAITVAVAYLRGQDRGKSSLGSALEAGPGPWRLLGRVQQAPRRRPGHHNGETGHGLR
jgi:Na+-transporting methylmalonyl-CoA/oxaloacetate decarboxylase gamma subunit